MATSGCDMDLPEIKQRKDQALQSAEPFKQSVFQRNEEEGPRGP
jgi:hypothetical protein